MTGQPGSPVPSQPSQRASEGRHGFIVRGAKLGAVVGTVVAIAHIVGDESTAKTAAGAVVGGVVRLVGDAFVFALAGAALGWFGWVVLGRRL